MAGLRLDHVSVVVHNLEGAKAFFAELGMELEGESRIEGEWVDRVNALDDVRVQIAMMRTPDGQGKLELTQFENPAVAQAGPQPSNTLGLRSVMFEVENIDETVERLRALGSELIGEVVDYEGVYRLCYVRGPGGVIVALAEDLR